MSDALDDEEKDLKLALMRADIANKRADSGYKGGLLRYEPWKVMATVMGATAAVAAAVFGALGYILGRIH